MIIPVSGQSDHEFRLGKGADAAVIVWRDASEDEAAQYEEDRSAATDDARPGLTAPEAAKIQEAMLKLALSVIIGVRNWQAPRKHGDPPEALEWLADREAIITSIRTMPINLRKSFASAVFRGTFGSPNS